MRGMSERACWDGGMMERERGGMVVRERFDG